MSVLRATKVMPQSIELNRVVRLQRLLMAIDEPEHWVLASIVRGWLVEAAGGERKSGVRAVRPEPLKAR